jgi:hypothetical protein
VVEFHSEERDMKRRELVLLAGLAIAALCLPLGLMGQAKDATVTLAIAGMT